MAGAIQHVMRMISSIRNSIFSSFSFGFPKEALALAGLNMPELRSQESPNTRDLKELLNNGILWAVPKKRKSIEKRRNKKFGWPNLHYKLLLPKTNILTCTKCGSYHEAGVLCFKCYCKVMEETKEMKEKIEAELGISPIENEVVVLYQDDEYNSDFFKGKRIVEMKKNRPKIFSNNLLQKSTQNTSNRTEAIPTDNLIKQ